MDIMVDIETLSTLPNAVILTIGAIRFDRNKFPTELKDMNTFYRRIELQSCNDLGMSIEETTKEWWSKQPLSAKQEAFENGNRIPIKQALTEFSEWFGDAKYIWSHGDDFDTVILSEAYRLCDLEKPWKFWNTRDTRTLFDIAGINNSDLPQNDKHHALHDCHRQIYGVVKSIEKLKL